jgi:hypothetical protein
VEKHGASARCYDTDELFDDTVLPVCTNSAERLVLTEASTWLVKTFVAKTPLSLWMCLTEMLNPFANDSNPTFDASVDFKVTSS